MKKNMSNWGNFPRVMADEFSFDLPADVVSILKEQKGFIARGNGRCYGDASLAKTVISTLRANKILSFDRKAGILECQSGITLDEVLKVIVKQGWFLPVTPGTKFITLGGAVASDVHGKNHHKEGSFGSHVLEMDVLTADGRLITCSADQYNDLFEASCGGMGLTGLVTRVKLQLKPIETAYIKQKQIKARNLDEAFALFEQYRDATYSVAWIDCLQSGKALGRSILMVGEHAQLSDLSKKQARKPLQLPDKLRVQVPFHAPAGLLNTYSVRAFNFLYYNKQKKEVDQVTPYETFFYPLDFVHGWNKLYGKPGFVQYQFVLPLENSREGLIKVLRHIAAKKLGSFLAVLKLFGKEERMISFPMEGYTLALDFPVRPGLFEFLDELDTIVHAEGGRVYLTKDARLNRDYLASAYPKLGYFKEMVKKYNPDYHFQSMQSQRLGLTV